MKLDTARQYIDKIAPRLTRLTGRARLLLTETIHYCVAFIVNECDFYSVHIHCCILSAAGYFAFGYGAFERIYVEAAVIYFFDGK